ncbi:hybrid sensor histidine kinase/response regulator [Methylophaga sp.]|uniref:hybrid sensor histidine kinase/response regulator n=1 Tax=Methylophaga sp. TaxID=2024840 RepID=UPI003F6A47F7
MKEKIDKNDTEVEAALGVKQGDFLNDNEASRLKAEFMSLMSHELRTPLNSIIGFTDLLIANGSDRSPKNQEYLEIVLSSARHLMSLIDKVVDISKLELGQSEVVSEEVEVSALIQASLGELAQLAEENAIKLVFNNVGQEIWCLGDRTRIKQVLVNLVSNAIKYNRPSGRVDVDVFQGEQTQITVSDTGLGIPEDKQSLIFEPFRRLSSYSTNIEGTGVGLTISKMFVEAMGGQIGVESDLGRGSKFWFNLCRLESFPQSNSTSTLALSETENKTPPSSNSLVLYIEDNAVNRLVMTEFFDEISGVELLLADNAHDGIALVKKNKPALILMDINLPGISGLKALQIIRGIDELKTIPIAAVSAQAMKHDIEEAMQLGMDDYLTKPVEFAKIRATVAKFVFDNRTNYHL